jgi:hypothetical protein
MTTHVIMMYAHTSEENVTGEQGRKRSISFQVLLNTVDGVASQEVSPNGKYHLTRGLPLVGTRTHHDNKLP